MQFDPITEKCLRNPMEIRKLPKAPRDKMLIFMRSFRLAWHRCRAWSGDAFGPIDLEIQESSKAWLDRRD